MMTVETAKITKLAIVDGAMHIDLDKTGTEWKLGKTSQTVPSDFAFDPSRVAQRVRSLASARALKVSPDQSPKTTGLAASKSSVTATLEDGKTVTLTFGNEIKEDTTTYYAARGNADGLIYLVAKRLRDDLLGDLMTFKKRPEAQPPGAGGFNPSQLANLPPDVRNKLMQQMAQKKQFADVVGKAAAAPKPASP
jgi:hypothetical protein